MELWSTSRQGQEGGSGQKCVCMWQDGAAESRFSEIPHGSGSQEEGEEGSGSGVDIILSACLSRKAFMRRVPLAIIRLVLGAGGAW